MTLPEIELLQSRCCDLAEFSRSKSSDQAEIIGMLSLIGALLAELLIEVKRTNK